MKIFFYTTLHPSIPKYYSLAKVNKTVRALAIAIGIMFGSINTFSQKQIANISNNVTGKSKQVTQLPNN